MAFVTLLSYGTSVTEILSERPTTTLVITTGEVGSSYGSSSSSSSSSLSSPSGAIAAKSSYPDLFEEVRIVCIVLTYADNRDKATHLKATWGKRCNRLIFISNQDDQDLGAVDIGVEDSHDNLWTKTRQAFSYVYENLLHEGEWFLKADDDTYIVMENLRYLLYGYDAQKPIYFGHKFTYDDNVYMSGGGGYVLSKEALKRFIVDSLNNETLCLKAQPSSEDFEIGKCLTSVGVMPGNSMDPIDYTQRFHPLPLRDYVQPDAMDWLPGWLFNRSLEPIQTGPSCCSEYAISFHYLESKDMYLYDFFLYRMKVHGIEKQLRALPSKISSEIG
ncbi:glycoprotein-N-acetylgalactosamine 3-beta-galactosyltransferase 1-like isoform X2 [Episyrphus balteatus]|nr:glycoprotein-N-acetylgalactosamine 3-beta-galactosyltransferase 1-like isoform X2 [Episyrphus balteatus]